MGRKALGTVGILIGMYLVAANATKWGTLMTDAGTAGSKVFKTLQGR